MIVVLAVFAAPSIASPAAKPNLGPNVLVFNPSMPAAEIQAQIDKVYGIQQNSEFGSARYALLFLPSVRFHHMITVALDTLGEISNVINDTDGPTATKPRQMPKLAEFP